MPRIPFTLRLDPEERTALENLSRLEGRPINQLVNEAVKRYLGRPGQRELSLEHSLAGLRCYRQRDPEFKFAISRFIDAESSQFDPLEGAIPETESKKPMGPAQGRIRELLNA